MPIDRGSKPWLAVEPRSPFWLGFHSTRLGTSMKSLHQASVFNAIDNWVIPLSLFVTAWLLPPVAMSQSGVTGDVCVGQYVSPANCTANDVRVEQFFVTSISESCSQGVPGEALVAMEVLITPISATVMASVSSSTSRAKVQSPVTSACTITCSRSPTTRTTGTRPRWTGS